MGVRNVWRICEVRTLGVGKRELIADAMIFWTLEASRMGTSWDNVVVAEKRRRRNCLIFAIMRFKFRLEKERNRETMKNILWRGQLIVSFCQMKSYFHQSIPWELKSKCTRIF